MPNPTDKNENKTPDTSGLPEELLAPDAWQGQEAYDEAILETQEGLEGLKAKADPGQDVSEDEVPAEPTPEEKEQEKIEKDWMLYDEKESMGEVLGGYKGVLIQKLNEAWGKVKENGDLAWLVVFQEGIAGAPEAVKTKLNELSEDKKIAYVQSIVTESIEPKFQEALKNVEGFREQMGEALGKAKNEVKDMFVAFCPALAVEFGLKPAEGSTESTETAPEVAQANVNVIYNVIACFPDMMGELAKVGDSTALREVLRVRILEDIMKCRDAKAKDLNEQEQEKREALREGAKGGKKEKGFFERYFGGMGGDFFSRERNFSYLTILGIDKNILNPKASNEQEISDYLAQKMEALIPDGIDVSQFYNEAIPSDENLTEAQVQAQIKLEESIPEWALGKLANEYREYTRKGNMAEFDFWYENICEATGMERLGHKMSMFFNWVRDNLGGALSFIGMEGLSNAVVKKNERLEELLTQTPEAKAAQAEEEAKAKEQEEVEKKRAEVKEFYDAQKLDIDAFDPEEAEVADLDKFLKIKSNVENKENGVKNDVMIQFLKGGYILEEMVKLDEVLYKPEVGVVKQEGRENAYDISVAGQKVEGAEVSFAEGAIRVDVAVWRGKVEEALNEVKETEEGEQEETEEEKKAREEQEKKEREKGRAAEKMQLSLDNMTPEEFVRLRDEKVIRIEGLAFENFDAQNPNENVVAVIDFVKEHSDVMSLLKRNLSLSDWIKLITNPESVKFGKDSMEASFVEWVGKGAAYRPKEKSYVKLNYADFDPKDETLREILSHLKIRKEKTS